MFYLQQMWDCVHVTVRHGTRGPTPAAAAYTLLRGWGSRLQNSAVACYAQRSTHSGLPNKLYIMETHCCGGYCWHIGIMFGYIITHYHCCILHHIWILMALRYCKWKWLWKHSYLIHYWIQWKAEYNQKLIKRIIALCISSVAYNDNVHADLMRVKVVITEA